MKAMKQMKTTAAPFILAAAVLAIVSLSSPSASGQPAKGLEKQLTLPKDAEKPDPPQSDSACFGKLAGGVLLEVILYENGSILGFEKRTLQDVMDRTSHAVRFRGDQNIRRLFQYAARLGGTKKLVDSEHALEMADVDLVIHAAPGVHFEHFFRLIRVACEDGIRIYRFHLVVRDRETGKKGLLTYYMPGLALTGETPEEKKRVAGMYSVGFWPAPDDLHFTFGKLSGEGSEVTVRSLKELEEEIEVLQKSNPDASIGLELHVPLEAPPSVKKPAVMKDLVDLMTLLGSKGADLKRIETVYREYLEIEEIEEEDG
jgi:hypothetical protein